MSMHSRLFCFIMIVLSFSYFLVSFLVDCESAPRELEGDPVNSCVRRRTLGQPLMHKHVNGLPSAGDA
jgi:hypothetical protein